MASPSASDTTNPVVVSRSTRPRNRVTSTSSPARNSRNASPTSATTWMTTSSCTQFSTDGPITIPRAISKTAEGIFTFGNSPSTSGEANATAETISSPENDTSGIAFESRPRRPALRPQLGRQLVPEQPGQAGDGRHRRALQPGGHDGESTLAQVRVPDQRGQQRVLGNAPPIRPARARQRPQVHEQVLHPQRRPELDHHARVAIGRVPQPVRNAGPDGEAPTGAELDTGPPDAERERALQHVVPLLLEPVHVRHRHSPTGRQRELERHQLAPGVGGSLQERQPLS